MSTNQGISRLLDPELPVLSAVMLAVSSAIIVGLPLFSVAREASKPRELSASEQHALDVAAMPKLDLELVARGKRFYNASCIACHGENARGVAGLGRDLVDGVYPRSATDAAMKALVIRGRTQSDPGFVGPVAMPPRGGRDDFDDAAIASVVAYVRALQEPSRIDAKPIPDVHVDLLDGPAEPTTPVPASAALPQKSTSPSQAVQVAADGSLITFDPETLKRGKRVYASCIACHAKDGGGVKGQGASLLDSAFVRSQTDVQLRDFIKTGRQPGAPGSRLNLAMPPKGGNPALKDNQIDDVVVYVRSLVQQAEQQQKK